MPIRQGSYGFKKGLGAANPDHAISFSANFKKPVTLPSIVNLHRPEWISQCYDQKQTSSCVLNMHSAITEYGLKRTPGMPKFTPSRLFDYAVVRELEGTLGEDAGSYCHDAFHQARFVGLIPEEMYPFSDDPKIVLAKPPQNLYDEAAKIQPKDFAPLDNANLDELKTCLAHGFPFGGGFQVPSVFETQAFSDHPFLSSPNMFARYVGGHGVAFFGYNNFISTDDGPGAFLVRNSWGTDWGIPAHAGDAKGLFWMSFKFATSKLLSDVWMTRFPGQEQTIIAE